MYEGEALRAETSKVEESMEFHSLLRRTTEVTEQATSVRIDANRKINVLVGPRLEESNKAIDKAPKPSSLYGEVLSLLDSISQSLNSISSQIGRL